MSWKQYGDSSTFKNGTGTSGTEQNLAIPYRQDSRMIQGDLYDLQLGTRSE